MSDEREWEIEIVDRRSVCVRVQAASYGEARSAGEAAMVSGELGRHVNVMRAHGEPWVTGGWYDLHEVGDVVVCERAYGNGFTEEEVQLLQERLEEMGLTVVESWNGAGSDTVSFRCTGRQRPRPMTKAQQRALCAPR